MNEIYLVIVEDRHDDIQIFLFDSKEKAIYAFELTIIKYNFNDTDPNNKDVCADMNYYIRYMRYTESGDCIYRIKKELNKEIEL